MPAPRSNPHPSAPATSLLTRRTLLRLGLGGGLAILGGSAYWWRGQGVGDTFRLSHGVMGTTAEMWVQHPGGRARPAAEAALEAVLDVAERMTCFNSVSEIGQVNARPGQALPLSADTGEVVRQGLALARASDGYFDPALGAWSAAWGFTGGNGGGQVPAPDELPAFDGRPAHYQVELSGSAQAPQVRLTRAGIRLDLGGIAKGFAVDQAVAVLRRQGVRNALVNLGGDLYALGEHPEGRPWQVGIRHPRRDGEFLRVLSLRDGAVATSGDYEKYFMRDGKRFHHLLDPHNGQPARGHQSMTVQAETALLADALATAAFTAPPEVARPLLRRLAPAGWWAVRGSGEEYQA